MLSVIADMDTIIIRLFPDEEVVRGIFSKLRLRHAGRRCLPAVSPLIVQRGSNGPQHKLNTSME